jgi:hypothetical protein
MEIRNAITNPAKMQKRVLGKIFSFGLRGSYMESLFRNFFNAKRMCEFRYE